MHTGLRRLLGGFAPLAVLFLAGPAAAEEAAASGLNSGDVAWILTSSAIVLMMTIPGLAFFYGGLVRGKNVLSVLMHCFICAGLISVTWVLWGYSIAFGGEGALWGGLIITPALIAGAIAERMKFSAFFLFVLLWSTFIYSPLCHWVWGEGGWLGARGALDFAGGTVVHISSGVSALVAVLVLGKRQGYGREPLMPHNLPFTVMGAGLLWVGWFGFNAGSALAADGAATAAFVNTNTATGGAVLGWVFTEWLSRGKPTALGAATGAVAGLVAITPAAGFVTPLGSILIGLVAGFLCYQACNLKAKLGYDDALDVVGVHGVGGTWGALATGVLASAAVGGTAGGMGQLREQIIAVVVTYIFAGIGTFVILQIVKATVGLRVHEDDESQGLDLSEHSETAYIH
jgi:Amt family ammonium transporter